MIFEIPHLPRHHIQHPAWYRIFERRSGLSGDDVSAILEAVGSAFGK